MTNTLYLPELREMLAENRAAELQEFCEAIHPARTAEFMEGLEPKETWEVLRHTGRETRAEIFGFLGYDRQVEIIEECDRAEVAQLLEDLSRDDAVDLLELVEPEVVDEVMQLIPAKPRRELLRLRAYQEGTAGSLMTTEFARLSENMTVGESLKEISEQASDLETIYYLYVVDEDDHLRGLVSARQLVSAMGKPNMKIADLMERHVVYADVLEDQEEVTEKVARYDLLAIPVVDAGHRLVGIVTHDDVIDVVREEAAEDAQMLAAIEPLDRGYLQTSLMLLTWKRAIWLIVFFFGALLTAIALQNYETTIASKAWLVFFIPLVISSGGNTGNQSATLVITALSTGNITLRDWMIVIRRELVLGIALGAMLATTGFLVAAFTPLSPGRLEAAVLAATVLLVVVFGAFAGATLPLIFSKIGLDPALMSSPFVACLIDILGIIIYMNVALAVLPFE